MLLSVHENTSQLITVQPRNIFLHVYTTLILFHLV